MPLKNTVHKKRPKVRGDFVEYRKLDHVDYKDVEFLRQFLSTYGKIMQRKRSHLSAKNQRKVSQAIKRARYLALIPYSL